MLKPLFELYVSLGTNERHVVILHAVRNIVTDIRASVILLFRPADQPSLEVIKLRASENALTYQPQGDLMRKFGIFIIDPSVRKFDRLEYNATSQLFCSYIFFQF